MVNRALQHVLLSPHFDDVVFSCGALVAQWARSGQRVAIVTICAGLPPAGPLSAYASRLHQRWNPAGLAMPAQLVAQRRAEDLRAADLLGAMAVHLTLPDCIYRVALRRACASLWNAACRGAGACAATGAAACAH